MQPETPLRPEVRVRNLTFRYGDKVIFDSIDLDVAQGSVTVLLGPSGTGKTTLLRAIVGQLRPHAGSVEVFGEDVGALDDAGLNGLRRRIGMQFQHGALFTDLSVFDNVAFPMREQAGLPESVVRDLVLLKLEAVGLRGAASLYPRELSGGMKHRVALARAVALDPSLLLYDEPFAGQDPIGKAVLLQLVRRLNDALGLTSLVITHDIPEAMELADELLVLMDGKLLARGDAASLRASADDRLRQFLNGEVDGPVAFHQPAPPLRDALLRKGQRHA